MEFDCSQITQSVEKGPEREKDVYEITTKCGEGYKNTLKYDCMKEVREYDIPDTGLRVVLNVADEFVGKQGYLCLLNKLMEKETETSEDDEYSDLYEENDICKPTIMAAVTKPDFFKSFQQSDDYADTSQTGLTQKDVSKVDGENVLFCIGRGNDPDKISEYLLKQSNKNIGVMMMPGDWNEYVIRRLEFEGGYTVLQVGKHRTEEYVRQGEAFLEYYGFHLNRECNLRDSILKLQAFRAEIFTEMDVYLFLSKAMQKAYMRKSAEVLKEDLQIQSRGEGITAMEEMQRCVGQSEAKEVINRLKASRKVLSESHDYTKSMRRSHTNMIFAGNPGTGKSMFGRVCARAFAESGLGNGRFEDVCRSDLIGKYVGHTAPRIRKIFQKAQGGVLFVDEASFLLADDIYIKEAIVEFVRFMELYPETTVIFATYEDEAERLLHVDPGFKSRISKVIHFADYSFEELYQIMEKLAEEYGVRLDGSCRTAVESYIDKIRRDHDFANGREVRKLLETAMEEYGIRKKSGEENSILCEDVERAADYLLRQRSIVPTCKIGF